MAPKTFSNESLSRCDQFYQIFVQIGANLAIFQPFEISIFFRNFERPFTPRNQLRSASNLAKTRFRRSPTFHCSTAKTNFRRNFRIEISCFRYFGQVFVCTQHTCVLCLYTTHMHMCVVCIHNTHVCCVYTRHTCMLCIARAPRFIRLAPRFVRFPRGSSVFLESRPAAETLGTVRMLFGLRS